MAACSMRYPHLARQFLRQFASSDFKLRMCAPLFFPHGVISHRAKIHNILRRQYTFFKCPVHPTLVDCEVVTKTKRDEAHSGQRDISITRDTEGADYFFLITPNKA
jgi:hypothetical protein